MHSNPLQIIYHLDALIIRIILKIEPRKKVMLVNDIIVRIIETEKELNLFHIRFRIPISQPGCFS